VLKHLQLFAETHGYKAEIFIDKMKGEAKKMPAKIFKQSKSGKISIFGGENSCKNNRERSGRKESRNGFS
jgi:hypothetical protein